MGFYQIARFAALVVWHMAHMTCMVYMDIAIAFFLICI
jgi:hypothetical protein